MKGITLLPVFDAASEHTLTQIEFAGESLKGANAGEFLSQYWLKIVTHCA